MLGGFWRMALRKVPSCPWPLANIAQYERPIADKLIAVKGPPQNRAQQDALDAFLDNGYKIIGVSAYQNFPHRIVNPHDSRLTREFAFFDHYRDRCVGWLHCFREPDDYLPVEVPRILLNGSDFMDYRRITPRRVDSISLRDEKVYDFAYVCLPGAWNEFCRNWSLARECVDVICNKFGLKMVLIGRADSRDVPASRNVTVRPQLPWYAFLQELNKARYLLVPNIFDASPRVVAEALCLDMPVLMNRNIVGGWHYINDATGDFFDDEADLEAALPRFLAGERRRARDYFCEHHGLERSGWRMFEFIQQVRKGRRRFVDRVLSTAARQLETSVKALMRY